MRWSVAALLAGQSLILYGLWLAWPPLAFVTAGGELCLLGLLRTPRASD